MKIRKMGILLLAMLLMLSGCTAPAEKKEAPQTEEEKEIADLHQAPIDSQFKGKTLKVASVSEDLVYAAKAFEQAYNCKVELSLRSENQAQSLLPGEEVADVYTIEASAMTRWLDSLLPLTDVAAEAFVPYTIAFASDSQKTLKALTWSVTPVNLYYRRSMAKQVLGDDSPETVAAAMSSLTAAAELGQKLQQSGYKLFANTEDLQSFYQVNDKVERAVLSEQEKIFLETIRQMDADYRLAGIEKWSENWFKSMYGKASNPVTGKNLDVFAYVLPSWGKSYLLERAGETVEAADVQNPTWGDWGMTSCPNAMFEEGLWLGIDANSQEAELAKAFIIYVTQNQAFLEKWLDKTRELPAYLPLLENYQMEAEDSFLGGQKSMPLYLQTIQAIPEKSAAQLEEEKNYYAVLEQYLQGQITGPEELQKKLAEEPR